MRRPVQGVAAGILGVLVWVGCASVPRESVELSVTMGRDLEVVHAANRRLAVVHFDRLLRDIDVFVDTVYRPFVIRRSIDDLDLVRLVSRTDGESVDPRGADLDALDILEVYVDDVVRRIETFRREVRAPIEEQRREVLESIDAAFDALRSANAVVTGHLASVVKVHDVQAETLAELGLGEYRDAPRGGWRSCLGGWRKLSKRPGKSTRNWTGCHRRCAA
ncbi:MAG: hypothetical protein Q9Q13_13805 [Acidobacteriota bacterium]|nr:hypothetical protein [Acidobacteriota bacterium]